MNKGLEKIGEGLINVSNLILVLYLFNIYLQQNDWNIVLLSLYLYGIITTYYFGYVAINTANQKYTGE